jgi:hypothetical protein
MLKRYFIVLFAFCSFNQKIHASSPYRKEGTLFSSSPVNNRPSPTRMIIRNSDRKLPSNLDALNLSPTPTRPTSSNNDLTPSFYGSSLIDRNLTPSFSAQTPEARNYHDSRADNMSPVGGPEVDDRFRNRKKPQAQQYSDDDERVSSSRVRPHDDSLNVSDITVAPHDSSSLHNISADTDTSAHDQDRLDHSFNNSVQSIAKGGKPTIDLTSSMKLHSDHIFKVLKTDKTSPFDGGHASGTWKTISDKYPKMIQIKNTKTYPDGTVEFSLLRPSRLSKDGLRPFEFTKTEFPASWSNQDIVNNTLRVYAFPDSFYINQSNRNNKSSNSSETKTIEITGIVDGVNIKVIVKRTITTSEETDEASKKARNDLIAQAREKIKLDEKNNALNQKEINNEIARINRTYPSTKIKKITAINDEIITAYPIHAGSKNEDESIDDEASLAAARGAAYSGPKSK